VRDEAGHKGDSEPVGLGGRRGPGTGGAGPKPPVSVARWALWWFLLAIGIFLFYILLTPIWIGLRALAWIAEFRARRRH
jgi:hypothetical protein